MWLRIISWGHQVATRLHSQKWPKNVKNKKILNVASDLFESPTEFT